MEPIVTGALIGAGASLLGGAMSSRAGAREAARDRRFQEAFARQGIQWRVADAQAAGVHPLYALGAPLQQASPIGINTGQMGQAVADAGQQVSRAIAATETADQKQIRELAIRRARAETRGSEAQALILDAQAQKLLREIRSQPSFPSGSFSGGIEGQEPLTLSPGMPMPAGSFDQLLPQPSKRVSSRSSEPHVETGRSPMGSVFDVSRRMEFMLPSKDATEALESISESLPQQVLWYSMNRLRYAGLDPIAQRAFDAMVEQETGVNPDFLNHIIDAWNYAGRSIRNLRDAAEAIRLFYRGPSVKSRSGVDVWSRRR